MKNIVILSQDTMASTVIMRKVLIQNHDKILAVVSATQLKGNSVFDRLKVARKLIKKTSFRFFLYKVIDSPLHSLFLTFHKFFKTSRYKKKDAMSIIDLAHHYNIPVIKTSDVNSSLFLDKIKKLNPDFVLSHMAQILKKQVFDVLSGKLINGHGSYLPYYRGGAQYIWHIINNDLTYGVTIHKMEAGIDTGDIILQKQFPFKKPISSYKLHYKIALGIGELFNLFIDSYIQTGNVITYPQNEEKATYWKLPTSKNMKIFNSKGGKLITIRDFFTCI